MRILSGIQPSGTLHIGNYFGMMKQCIELQDMGEAFFLIVDYHALTVSPEPELLRERVKNAAISPPLKMISCYTCTKFTIQLILSQGLF